MRNIEKGKVLNLQNIISIKPNQTISKRLDDKNSVKLLLFGLAEGTDISEELYEDDTLYINIDGIVEIGKRELKPFSVLSSNRDESFDIKAKSDCILLEISYKKGEESMHNVEKGKVFELKNLLDYVDGGVANLDIVSRDDLKIMVMAFDEGEGLTPHSAPGDAMVIALEGSAVLQIGDEEHEIHAGEQLVFPKDIVHNVTAKTKYKMALVLVK